MDAPAIDRASYRKLDFARRFGLAAVAAGSLGVGFLLGEAALIAPVIFFEGWLGFMPGLIVFTASCVILGLGVLGAVDHFWPSRGVQSDGSALGKGAVRQVMARVGRRSLPVGAMAVALYCGPFASPPILRALGYQGRSLMIWVIGSGLVFGIFWFSFYGGAFSVLKRVLL
jgi:hypothetical protein